MTEETFDKARDGTGTREWSDTSYNIGTGCSHGCLYCYARQHALRFRLISRSEDWTTEHCHANKIVKRFGKRRGVIMYPTTHDITPGPYLEGSLIVLRSMLEAGNQVLVVTKPHLMCIKRICEELGEFDARLMFRFTIGSGDDGDLRFWEPGAPTYAERFESLHHASACGFRTSVSMEPLLCSVDKAAFYVDGLSPLVSDTIWIGLMNKPRERTAWANRLPELDEKIRRMEQSRTLDSIMLYNTLKGNPKVRWKDSIGKSMKHLVWR